MKAVTTTIEVYKDRAGQFRWRARARNGRIVASSSEGFVRYRNCRNNLLNAQPGVCTMPHKWHRGAKRMTVNAITWRN